MRKEYQIATNVSINLNLSGRMIIKNINLLITSSYIREGRSPVMRAKELSELNEIGKGCEVYLFGWSIILEYCLLKLFHQLSGRAAYDQN